MNNNKKSPLLAAKGLISGGKQNFVIILAAVALFAIFTLINPGFAKQGKSIIMISSELPEVLRMSDRIIVMCEGRKTGELDISEATQENIMQLATMREEN